MIDEKDDDMCNLCNHHKSVPGELLACESCLEQNNGRCTNCNHVLDWDKECTNEYCASC